MKRSRSPKYTTITGKAIPERQLQKQRSPRRNDPCPCGSGVKYKKCCMPKPAFKNRPRGSVYKTMQAYYTQAQQEAEQAFIKQWGFQPNPAQLLTFVSGAPDEIREMILGGLAAINAEPKYVHAVKKLGMLITSRNQALCTEAEKQAWAAALQESETANGNDDSQVRDDGMADISGFGGLAANKDYGNNTAEH